MNVIAVLSATLIVGTDVVYRYDCNKDITLVTHNVSYRTMSSKGLVGGTVGPANGTAYAMCGKTNVLSTKTFFT